MRAQCSSRKLLLSPMPFLQPLRIGGNAGLTGLSSPVSLARNILRFNACSSSQMQKFEWLPAGKIGFTPRGSFHWEASLQAESNLRPGSNPQAEKTPVCVPQTPGPQLIRQFNIWRTARHPPIESDPDPGVATTLCGLRLVTALQTTGVLICDVKEFH